MEHVDLVGLRCGLGLVPILLSGEGGDLAVQLEDFVLQALDLFLESLQSTERHG